MNPTLYPRQRRTRPGNLFYCNYQGVRLSCLDSEHVHQSSRSLRSCPLPIIPLCLSREEGMIHFFVGSHVKKPESGLFSDWIGNHSFTGRLLHLFIQFQLVRSLQNFLTTLNLLL